MEHLFQPFSIDHSIRESVITFFLATPIVKPKRFLDFDNGLKDEYASRKIVKQAKIVFEGDIDKKEHNSSANYNDEAGFVLTKFVDGKPSNVFQGLNDKEERQYFSFHTFNYTRWTEFKASFYNLIRSYTPELTNTFIVGIGLHYIDEFVWNAEDSIDNTKLFDNNSQYLPKAFFESKNSDYLLTTTNKVGALDYFARSHIRLVCDKTTRTRVSHNILFKLEEAQELVEIISKSPGNKESLSEGILNRAHQLNVALMYSLLRPEVSKAIGLENKKVEQHEL